jgi:hypothetical protein
MRTREALVAEVSIAWGDAYADWLAALAASAKQSIDIHRPETPLPEDVDEQTAKISDRVTAAEHRMIQARPTVGWQLLQKFEVLRAMLRESEVAGAPADGRHLLMLESLHIDLMNWKLDDA